MSSQERDDAVLAREQLDQVTGALAALTETLERDPALDAALRSVCERVVEVVPGADMASVTLIRAGTPETAAFSDGYAVDIDQDQYGAGEGPCLEAAVTGRMVRADVAGAHARWPVFARTALAAGVASYLSAPLVVDDRHAGSLNLYGTHPHGFREVDGALLEMYLTAVELALRATVRYLHASRQAGELTEALVSRAVIDQAKGIIMGANGVTADQAFQVLVDRSQRDNVKLHTLAERLVAAVIVSPAPRRRRGRDTS